MKNLATYTFISALALSACKKENSSAPTADQAKNEKAKVETPATSEKSDLPAPADVAAPPSDALKTSSGLASKVIKAGTGTQKPTKWDTVEVHYTGWTTDGKMFDSSKKRNRTAKFGLRQVIPGWTEGLQLMVQGEQRRFWIPTELAYNNMPGKPKGMLVFDVELVAIQEGPKPIPAPADVAQAPADAQKTASGLQYKILSKGSGAKAPAATDRVEVHYTGWTSSNGEMFDSSVQRGRTATFAIRGVIPGWTEGLQLMKEGDKARFWIPANLAYGEVPKRPGAPAGQLTFDVELIKIIVPPKMPEAPSVVKAAAASAAKTASGLASRVLKAGTGKTKPKATDRVEVHYSGWTTDGKMFDSSIKRGRPATFGLNQVIKGWTEGLQLMVEGEKRRFWIPGPLAYGDTPKRPGAPAGTLVFDVELLKINP